MQTHNANIIKQEARDRVVYRVFFFVTVFAVSAIWLDYYCVSCVRVRETQKGNANRDKKLQCLRLLNHRLHSSPDEPGLIPWARSPAEGSGSGAGWAERLHTAVESGCVGWSWSPLKSSADPYTFSQPGAPALITCLGYTNTWYQHNAALLLPDWLLRFNVCVF